MGSFYSNFQRVSFRCTERLPMVKSCKPQKQLEFFLENPACGHRELIPLIRILNKTAIQDQLIVEINLTIHALSDRTPCFGMLPGMPATLCCDIALNQLPHSDKPEIKEKVPLGAKWAWMFFSVLDFRVLRSQHRKTV